MKIKKLPKVNSEISLLLILIFLGTALRLRNLDLNLWLDEFYTAAVAKGILIHGLPTLPSNLIYIRALPYSYIVAFSTLLFGLNEIALRLPSVIFGVITIPLLFIFLRSFVTPLWSLIGTALLTFSSWHIVYSEYARMYSLFTFSFLLSIVFFHYFIIFKKKKYLFLSFFAFCLALSLHLFALSLLSLFLYWVISQKGILKKKVFYFSSAIFGIATIIALFFYPPTIAPWPKDGITSYSFSFFPKPSLYFLKELFKWFPVGSIIIILTFPFISKSNKKLLLPSFIFLCSLLLLSIYPLSNLQPRYLSFLPPIYYASLVTSLFFIKEKLNSSYSKRLQYFLFISILTIIIPEIVQLKNLETRNYGQIQTGDLLISESFHYFPDNHTTWEYLTKSYLPGDTVISLQPKGQAEMYSKHRIDYLLRTAQFVSEGHFEKGVFVDDYFRTPIITNINQLQNILKTNKRVWIISSASELPKVNHIDKATHDFLQENKNKVVYTGKEASAKVYLFTH